MICNNITAEVINVTPDMASEWLENCMYGSQRPLRDNHIAFLSGEIRKGNFKQGTVIEFAVFNGQEVLTDGQHRLAAIIRTGISSCMVLVRISVNSKDELAKNYSYIDIGKMRKWADVVRAMGKGEIHLSASQLNALKSALGAIYRGFMDDGIRESNVEMFNKTLEWQPYAKLYFDAVSSSNPSILRPLQRRHMVALGISTIRFATALPYGKSAIDFWNQVAIDDGLRIGDPRKKLRELLIESQVVSTTRKSSTITAKQGLLYGIRAWNAYTENERLTRLLLPKSGRLPISYTPFDFSMTIAQYRTCFENSYWGEEWKDV